MLGQTLGEGEFGKVKLGWPVQRSGSKTDAQVAIKLIRRESVGTSRSRMNKIEREIKVLRKVRHPNIVKCYEVIETEKHIGIILEYASGKQTQHVLCTRLTPSRRRVVRLHSRASILERSCSMQTFRTADFGCALSAYTWHCTQRSQARKSIIGQKQRPHYHRFRVCEYVRCGTFFR